MDLYGPLDLAYGLRVGGVEHIKLRVAFRAPEGFFHYQRGKARPAHAQKDNGRKAGVLHLVGKALYRGAVRLHHLGKPEPPQRIAYKFSILGAALPQGCVFGPEPLKKALALYLLQRRGHGGLEPFQCETQYGRFLLLKHLPLLLYAGLDVAERDGKLLYPVPLEFRGYGVVVYA